MRLVKTKKSFRKELKRQLRYAIAAAVGFLIIYAWRDAILGLTKDLISKIQKTTAIASLDIMTALTISVIGVLIIIISSKVLKD